MTPRPARDATILVLVALALYLYLTLASPAVSRAPDWRASMYDPAPEGRPVVGYWEAPFRAHVVVMIRGRAYESAGPEDRVLMLEDSPPVLWWELP